MKTLSGTVRLVVLATVAVATALALRGFAQSSPSPAPAQTEPPDPPPSSEKFVLKIKPRAYLKDQSPAGEEAFAKLLSNGKYSAGKGNKVNLRHAVGAKEEDLPRGGASSSQFEIKTDQVTVSQTAMEIEVGELTAIQPHVTVQVASKDPADIAAVLDKIAADP
jgi:hypothetical protein